MSEETRSRYFMICSGSCSQVRHHRVGGGSNNIFGLGGTGVLVCRAINGDHIELWGEKYLKLHLGIHIQDEIN